LALLLPIYLGRDGLRVADLGFTAKPRAIDCVRAAAAGACVWMTAQALLRLGSILTGGARINVSALLDMKEAMASLGSLGLGELFGLFLPMLVMAPFIEEILYRGVVVTSLRACWGESPRKNLLTACVSGFLFAVVHGLGHPLYYGVYFLIGLAFALLYQRTRSLTAVMIAHGVFNVLPLVKFGVTGLLATLGLRA
jgi:membrane protease YdiL (CAAX protease family)